MLRREGIAVSPGIAIGPALVLGAEGFRIPKNFVSIDAVDVEVERFRAALQKACAEIERTYNLAKKQVGDQYAAIFAAHLQMARDPKLIEEIESLIREKCYSPEFATSRVLRRYGKILQNLDSQYLAERADDVFDLEKRLLRHLLGRRREELSHLRAPVVVVAQNLTPSETASLNPKYVLGFATEAGGRTSHTAILAGALELPAVVGLGPFLSDVSGGSLVIIDGNRGVVIVDPDEQTLREYEQAAEHFRKLTRRLARRRTDRARTKDGTEVAIYANIEFPQEVDHCRKRGADGIGLYRTEFLYLDAEEEPTEEEQYEAYKKVVLAFPDRPVVFRTLDLGADKLPGAVSGAVRSMGNPALGLRSIRVSLRNLESFKTQLRAILRAAVHGQVKIMFPLVTTLLELRQAKMVLGDVIEDLEDQGIPFRRNVPVGIMVEVPATAVLADRFAAEVDFFSIGTNDLIQYTLAADRSDPSVADIYSAGDPAVLVLLKQVIEAANKHNIPVSICGEMGGDLPYVPLLIGMGIRQLSVAPHAIPEVREVIRSIDLHKAQEIASHALELDYARDVDNFLQAELQKILPELTP